MIKSTFKNMILSRESPFGRIETIFRNYRTLRYYKFDVKTSIKLALRERGMITYATASGSVQFYVKHGDGGENG